MSLCNSISFENLKEPAKEFSRVRLFGSFGWIGAGFLISAFKLETLSIPFLISSIVSLLAGLYALTLPYKKPVKINEKVTIVKILGFDAIKLTKNRSFLILLIFSALVCIPLS